MGQRKVLGLEAAAGILHGKAPRRIPEVLAKHRLGAQGAMYAEWELLKFLQLLRDTVAKDYRK